MTARGLKCQIGITEGQECLSVPVPLIISDDVILRTDLASQLLPALACCRNVFRSVSTEESTVVQALALLQISAVDAESVKLIWTMVDRHDPDSHFAAFWQALPLAIETGELWFTYGSSNLLTAAI